MQSSSAHLLINKSLNQLINIAIPAFGIENTFLFFL
mgnify:CR=1 FL=1